MQRQPGLLDRVSPANAARKVRAAGFTLIEVMLALGLGLFLVSACASVLIGHMTTQRQALMESRLTQELRQAADLLARDVRRAGYWVDAHDGVWSPPGSATGAPTSPPPANPHTGMLPPQGSDSVLAYGYDRRAGPWPVQSNERFGWRIHPTSRALEVRLGGNALTLSDADNWQAVTDPNTVRMRSLSVRVELLQLDTSGRCAVVTCPGGGSACRPQTGLRLVQVDLEGAANADATLVRRLRSTVRVRTDAQDGACPA